MSHWAAACLVSIALATPSHAQEQPTQGNGAELVANCRANSPACGAYLQGVLDMMIVARRDECAAPRYDRSAMRAAYLRWADANSYFLAVHMAAGAERALGEAWQCKPQVDQSSMKWRKGDFSPSFSTGGSAAASLRQAEQGEAAGPD